MTFRLPCLSSWLLAFAVVTHVLTAAPSEWPDADGTRFKGEPVGVLGPLALFRTKAATLKRVPLHFLPPEDCQRLYQTLSARPPRAARWADARGQATRDLIDNTLRFDGTQRKLVPADLTTLPEPELLVVFYGQPNLPGSWLIVNNIGPNYARVQRQYPGLAYGVFYGIGASADDHASMASSAWMPWLVTNYARQGRIATLRKFADSSAPRFAVLTRDGDPIILEEPTDTKVVRRLVDEFIGLAWLTHPYNTRAWPDRAHYGRAVRPLQFANSQGGAELVGNPLRPDGLRLRGVQRVEARIDLDDTGKVTAATLLPGSRLPEKFATAITDALRRSAVFLPAIDHGTPVASTYDYVLEVPPADPRSEADATWLDLTMNSEIPLLNWLLLTSLPVREQDFTEVERVGADGKVYLTALEVSTAKVSGSAQKNAFLSNYFDEAGAGSVAPRLGQTESIEGRTLTWRAVKSTDGYVNMKTGHTEGPDEYSVGYAYTEIETSADLTAWLGIGSDDGLKVWLNGELVNDRWMHRISQLDADVVPLKLKAGKNRLLLKVQNKTRDWSFTARLRYRDR